jgi:Holliday junction resolvase RusA-like endonuclease
MKIQIDIPEELNKKLKFEKLKRDCSNLQKTIIKILEDYFKKKS